LGVGAFCTILLVFAETKIVEKLEYTEWYKVGAALSNIIAVLAMSYLIITSDVRSAIYKFFIVLLLTGGLIAEIILTNAFSNLSPQYLKYILIVFNIVLRMYTAVQLIQEPWDVVVMLTSRTGATETPPVVKEIEKTILPQNVERVQDADAAKFVEQWKTLFRQARKKVGDDNLDEISRERGYKEIILPAVSSRDFSRDRLKDASQYLKDKSGNIIPDLTFGGRRRKR
jgi:hypothetical protein